VIKGALDVINQMQSGGVIGSYAIGGAVGATFYLEPSATIDLDIFTELPQATGSSLLSLSPIYDHLKAEGHEITGEHVVIGGWPVQFLPVSSALEIEALSEAIETEVEGTSTRVMRAEHLIAISLQAGRLKDHNRILQFLELKRIDNNKLRRILQKHSLVPKWEQFEKRYLHD
jgi:hypothetical protein